MATFQAGRLRDRITIRRAVNTPTGKGGFERGWEDVAVDIRAEVVSQGGREALIASTMQGVESFKITIRYRTDIKSADQILYRPFRAAEDKELNIRSATEDPFNPRVATVIFADTESPQGA